MEESAEEIKCNSGITNTYLFSFDNIFYVYVPICGSHFAI